MTPNRKSCGDISSLPMLPSVAVVVGLAVRAPCATVPDLPRIVSVAVGFFRAAGSSSLAFVWQYAAPLYPPRRGSVMVWQL